MHNNLKKIKLILVFIPILCFSLILVFGCTTKSDKFKGGQITKTKSNKSKGGQITKTKTDFSKINKTEFPIKSCRCDLDCYTDEIKNLKCDKKWAYFDSNGLPDKSHTMMKGITRTNQHIPLEHDYHKKITLNPKFDEYHIDTEAGAIGIAVNGVPLFSPYTQGARHPETGKRPHTLDVGELDECGAHAGRGDDYHYHIAPKCLIEEMGIEQIDHEKKPIGYARDGFPIHAVGWFDPKNDIEIKLDVCRGIEDSNGSYFYNVQSVPKWDVINCYTGMIQKGGLKSTVMRKDKNGVLFRKMIPIKYEFSDYVIEEYGEQKCHFLNGNANIEKFLTKNGNIINNYQKKGAIFYCSPMCYGYFIQSPIRKKGRVVEYELVKDDCPKELNLKKVQFDD